MEVRHIAATALMGWYLMIPPRGAQNGTQNLRLDAPLTEWRTGPTLYESRSACIDAKAKLRQIAQHQRDPKPIVLEAPDGTKSVWSISPLFKPLSLGVRCVASDDSRLAPIERAPDGK